MKRRIWNYNQEPKHLVVFLPFVVLLLILLVAQVAKSDEVFLTIKSKGAFTYQITEYHQATKTSISTIDVGVETDEYCAGLVDIPDDGIGLGVFVRPSREDSTVTIEYVIGVANGKDHAPLYYNGISTFGDLLLIIDDCGEWQ